MENKTNIAIVVDLLKKNNIHHVVISPGGTNIPFVNAVQDDDFFTCYSVVDERSAIYFAIGLYLQTGEIIVTSCTSAQATRNYIPGLTEAFYKRVPILAITMAKHPRFTYQEYMQAPDQTSLPKDCVKASYMLPFISQKEDILHSNRLIAQAIQTLTVDGTGPVQICIPWLDFNLDDTDIRIKNIEVWDAERIEQDGIEIGEKKVLLAIGEHTKFSEKEKSIILDFCEKHNIVVYANHLSNFYNKYTVKANILVNGMQSEVFTRYSPDLLITIGGQTGDYPFYNMLSQGKFQRIVHWRVSPDGKVVDTYDKLTRVFKCSEYYFFSHCKASSKVDHNYYRLWNEAMKKTDLEMALPFSNAAIAQYLCDKIPKNSIMQFSILNSLRIWNFFPLHPSVECYSNVAAFGIDGGMSTLIGQSVATDRLSFMIIGDLAFLYDINSISIRHIKPNLRIIIINNNGGIEFKYSKKNNDKMNLYIAAGNHYKNAAGWAETCGFAYWKAENMDELKAHCDALVQPSDKPIILEAFVSDIDEANAYEIIMDHNRMQTVSGSIKLGIKATIVNTIGEQKLNKIKEILK